MGASSVWSGTQSQFFKFNQADDHNWFELQHLKILQETFAFEQFGVPAWLQTVAGADLLVSENRTDVVLFQFYRLQQINFADQYRLPDDDERLIQFLLRWFLNREGEKGVFLLNSTIMFEEGSKKIQYLHIVGLRCNKRDKEIAFQLAQTRRRRIKNYFIKVLCKSYPSSGD